MATAFGNKVREKRLELRRQDPGFSLRQVASRLNISPCYLSEIERGVLPPPMIDTVYLIAADLGMDEDYLIMLSGRIGAEVEERSARSPVFSQAVCHMLKMSKEELKMIGHVAGEISKGKGGHRKIRV
jgi:transcriptional regulator with XRE-family HTH domain